MTDGGAFDIRDLIQFNRPHDTAPATGRLTSNGSDGRCRLIYDVSRIRSLLSRPWRWGGPEVGVLPQFPSHGRPSPEAVGITRRRRPSTAWDKAQLRNKPVGTRSTAASSPFPSQPAGAVSTYRLTAPADATLPLPVQRSSTDNSLERTCLGRTFGQCTSRGAPVGRRISSWKRNRRVELISTQGRLARPVPTSRPPANSPNEAQAASSALPSS